MRASTIACNNTSGKKSDRYTNFTGDTKAWSACDINDLSESLLESLDRFDLMFLH
jgi:hypothetical protein